MNNTETLPLAGWYPSPSRPGTEMYWDGHRWQPSMVRDMDAPPMLPAPPTPGVVNYPGKGLGSAAVILSLLFWPVGLILGIIAWSQSKAAGFKNRAAVTAMFIGGIWGFLVIVFLTLASI